MKTTLARLNVSLSRLVIKEVNDKAGKASFNTIPESNPEDF